jgi:hypothetical protein
MSKFVSAIQILAAACPGSYVVVAPDFVPRKLLSAIISASQQRPDPRLHSEIPRKENRGMRKVIAASAMTAALVVGSGQLHAAPAELTKPTSTPLRPLLHAGYYYGWHPACPEGYYYACRYDPYRYGNPYCACWPYWNWWAK